MLIIAVVSLAAAVVLWPGQSAASYRLLGPSDHPDSPPDTAADPGAHTPRTPAAVQRHRLLAQISAAITPQRRQPPTTDDAWTVDLLGALMAAGLDSATALRCAGETGRSPTADVFVTAAAAVASGVPVARAIEPGTSAAGASTSGAPIPETAHRVGVALARSTHSGAAITDALDRVSTWARTQAATRKQAAAERAGVMIAGPLGACFLPAFVCIGIIPVIVGLAGSILPEVLP